MIVLKGVLKLFYYRVKKVGATRVRVEKGRGRVQVVHSCDNDFSSYFFFLTTVSYSHGILELE